MLKVIKAGEQGEKIVTKVRYNGKEKSYATGQLVDVRDFDVANKDVRGCENHLMLKNPGVFEITKESIGVNVEEVKALKEENKLLHDALGDARNEYSQLKKSAEENMQKIEALAGEVEQSKKAYLSIKKESDKLKKENEDLQDEVSKLRGQITKR